MTELIGMIQSAAKAKAPIVAIPREGLTPICLRSKLLKGALKGVTITAVTVLDHGWLQIQGTAGRVRTSAKFAPLNRNVALNELSKWTWKEREKRKALILKGATAKGSSKFDVVIKRLSSELGTVPRIPCAWNKRPSQVDAYERMRWSEWRADKVARTTRYRAAITKYGRDLARINAHEHRPSLYSRWYEAPKDEWGTARYANYLTWRKETAHIREQIASVEELRVAA